MITAKNPLLIENAPDILGPREIARILNSQLATGYELFKRADFPGFKIGKKHLVAKKAFVAWLERQGQKDTIAC
ncbi:Helix-turn-helix domain protein [Acididesulfobacillus acetoxydans]|uniref:Helix-turn-helix domain n=1 Tax=Acididesulfobacillus acetoxydans TaxID=1561005 RepID=A0A8S0VY00_9FIRM|nr:helix-turn-helix domain-containing protein [Acididesulfobacillus acetoxydans]CAA7602463.1 Helix-turn-helix domain protein [Acididesulfobacillus acetoxydans]CEJ05918.1 Helix-turn-helix domain [Acididesulfobacillus acetoxydans]